MLEALREFFSSHFFMPHGHCYLWKPELVWLQVITNGLIGLSYMAISLTLAYLVKRGQYIPFKGMALAFGLFIVTCGVTHFFDVYVIWKPAYWLDGAVRAITALASVTTALILPTLVPKAIALAQGARVAHERGIKLEAVVQDLETMYEKTKELEHLKSQFFANVSHELRTPLALIIGPAEKLLAAGNLTDEQRRDGNIILRNAGTLLRHVNDLLDASRLDSGKMEAQYARTDVARLVRLTAGHFDGLAADQGMDYRMDVPETLWAEVDPDKIQRVVLNLLSNAFKFTPQGGAIRCSVHTQADGPVVVEVADSGPGIQPEHRQIVFERFRQLDGGATRRFGGTGLGLAIARDFVELHRGTIEVTDAPEGGALFRVSLPLSAPQGVQVKAASAEVSSSAESATRQVVEELKAQVDAMASLTPGNRPLVLVVEDNPEMNRFICEALRDQYRTERALNGKEGLRKALALRPDLILSDIMMPEMSGEDMVNAIRKRPELEAIPIMLLTARADEEIRIKLLRAGAQDYLMKPFATDELLARVANLVTIKRARDVLQQALATQMQDLEALAREVTDRKRDLETAFESMRIAREHAERASKIRADFLSMVSHELRTPLAALCLQLERIQVENDATLSAQARELVQRMKTSTSRLTDLIEGLLQYTRLQSGRMVSEIEAFDPARLARECMDEVRPQAQAKNLALELDIADELPLFSSDPRLVHLIVVNLLGNAIKFTNVGSVTLAVSATRDMCQLSVTDTGPGIAPEHRMKIFEPFEQVEPVRQKHVAGAGLGLTLVREMTSALGGTIALDSEVGRGSTFTVTLPGLEKRIPSEHA